MRSEGQTLGWKASRTEIQTLAQMPDVPSPRHISITSCHAAYISTLYQSFCIFHFFLQPER